MNTFRRSCSRHRRPGFRRICIAVASCSLAWTANAGLAHAGDFDAAGRYIESKDNVFFEDFAAPQRYLPDGIDMPCLTQHFEVADESDSLSGTSVVQLKTPENCPERFVATVPSVKGSYRATVWIRHGSAGARLIVKYPTGANRADVSGLMAPTGRATSDGWIELASNDVPIDASDPALAPIVYLWMVDFADTDSLDVDAFELVSHGDYIGEIDCKGARDPVCGEGVCIGGKCQIGRLSVPPLPEGQLKNDIVDTMEGQLQNFFGGKKTRLQDLPVALETLESLRHATTPWQFWNGWATAIHQLHDWHTTSNGAIGSYRPSLRLNACFIEGDADLSHGIVPKHPQYKDILVSHIGADSGGLSTGDRLVAVEGQHPIEWARKLGDVNWGYHVASDASSFADSAEELGGPSRSGSGAIVRFAKNITVIRCSGGTCDGAPETIEVSSLTGASGGPNVSCDNRPFYHLDQNGPDPANHRIFENFFQGPISGTTPQEAIYGMVWDTLYGGGDPNSTVNSTIRNAVTFWKANARGVILDHRAGNGGTLDAAEFMSEIGRAKQIIAVVRMPMETAGFTGPTTTAEGVALYDQQKTISPYTVGSDSFDPALPVALIIHRDGSASDYMPFGMKGSPHVKLFGPGPTAGAFSTFIQFSYWGGISYQFASGDTITFEGDSLMGHAVWPDFVVQQKQSDLLAGKDSIHEAALAWVRSELK